MKDEPMSVEATKTVNRQGKLPLSKKTGYGSIEFSNSMVFTCFMTFGMFFFTDIVGLAPSVAGSILAIGTLWDAITDPLFGVLSDRSKNRYGRRRPFILGVAVPFALVTWLMFTNWGFGVTGTKIYFMLMVIAYFTAMTALDVPYTALGAEMTQDYDERTSLNTWRALFCQVGALIGGVLPITLAAKLGDSVGDISSGWSYTGLILGVLASIVILYGWRMTRGGELFPETTHIKFRDIITGPFKNKPFLYVIGFYTMGIMVMSFGTSLFVYYFKDFMMYEEAGISIAMAVVFIPSFLWIPLVNYVSKRFSKKLSWLIFAVVYLISNVCLYLFVQPGNDITLYIILAVMSVMALIPYQIGWSIIPDCVEIDEYKTGARREGLYYGIVTFIQKGGGALAIWIAGILLEKVGYNAELTVQASATMDGVRRVMVGGPFIMTVIGIILLALFPLTKEKHKAILRAIEASKNGETVDESRFEDCIR